jgi:hypothetical protein
MIHGPESHRPSITWIAVPRSAMMTTSSISAIVSSNPQWFTLKG